MFMLFFDRSKKILIFWSLPDAYFFSRPSQILFTFWSEPALIPHFFYLPNHSSYIFLLRATFGSIQLFTFSSGSEPHSLSFLILAYLSKPHLNVCSSIFLEVLPNCPYVKSAKFISFWFNLLHIIIRRADNDPCLSKGSLQCQFLHNFCDCQNCTLFCQKDVNLEN